MQRMFNEEIGKLESLLNLLSYPTVAKKHDDSPADEEGREIFQVPSHIPILPLRGLVVFPMTAVPIRVGQPRSVRLIDDAIIRKQLIGLVTSRDPEVEDPGPEDVYRVGTIAAVHLLFKSPDGTLTLIMQGLMRIRVEEFKISWTALAA